MPHLVSSFWKHSVAYLQLPLQMCDGHTRQVSSQNNLVSSVCTVHLERRDKQWSETSFFTENWWGSSKLWAEGPDTGKCPSVSILYCPLLPMPVWAPRCHRHWTRVTFRLTSHTQPLPLFHFQSLNRPPTPTLSKLNPLPPHPVNFPWPGHGTAQRGTFPHRLNHKKEMCFPISCWL